MVPKIDLLALWDEVFEMKQEKQALNGEPHTQFNPYSPYITRNSSSESLGDQTGDFLNTSRKGLQGERRPPVPRPSRPLSQEGK